MQLARYLRRDLPADQRAGAEEHLDACPECRALIVELVKYAPDVFGDVREGEAEDTE